MRARRYGSIAQANALPSDDPNLYAAARATGADVPVCLDPRPRIMRGIGEMLSAPLALPKLPALLVNPGVALPTKAVFAEWTPTGEHGTAAHLDAIAKLSSRDQVLQFLGAQSNDLEPPAVALQPVIAGVLAALRELPGCKLARMSGSGATCFALFAADRGGTRSGENNVWQISALVGEGDDSELEHDPQK